MTLNTVLIWIRVSEQIFIFEPQSETTSCVLLMSEPQREQLLIYLRTCSETTSYFYVLFKKQKKQLHFLFGAAPVCFAYIYQVY